MSAKALTPKSLTENNLRQEAIELLDVSILFGFGLVMTRSRYQCWHNQKIKIRKDNKFATNIALQHNRVTEHLVYLVSRMVFLGLLMMV